MLGPDHVARLEQRAETMIGDAPPRLHAARPLSQSLHLGGEREPLRKGGRNVDGDCTGIEREGEDRLVATAPGDRHRIAGQLMTPIELGGVKQFR
jgi:hypothetical protein